MTVRDSVEKASRIITPETNNFFEDIMKYGYFKHAFAILNKPGEITLTGFRFIKELWWNGRYTVLPKWEE